MSGTSLDGVDLVYVKMNAINYSDYKIIFSKTILYEEKWTNILKNAIHYSKEKLLDLDIKYGAYLGNLILHFILENEINQIDFVSSHGHTILHQPDNGITLQIGNGQEIANITGLQVVCDFRTQDIQLGGQGAPLVPIGDELLFSKYDSCLNLGGFANVSYQKNKKRIAFDICPVNVVLNHYSQKLGFSFDKNGELSSRGKVLDELLVRLNSLNFYKQKLPKSLGLEWVCQHVYPLLDSNDYDIKDILRTWVCHITDQLSISLKGSVFVTGGGVFNSFLINELKRKYGGELLFPSKTLIEYKEALIFVLLGLLRLQNKNNCLSSVTGSLYDHSSGRIFNPNFN